MLCGECGESNIQNAKFCQNCGAELDFKPELASLGNRVAAFLLDLLVTYAICFGVAIGLIIVLGGLQFDETISDFTYLINVIIFFGYFILLEGRLGGGQTIGKRVIHIKVVKEENVDVMGYTQSFVRNILRIIDGLFCYIVGIILIDSSDKNQRLGDRAAHTLVIKEK